MHGFVTCVAIPLVAVFWRFAACGVGGQDHDPVKLRAGLDQQRLSRMGHDWLLEIEQTGCRHAVHFDDDADRTMNCGFNRLVLL